MKNHNLKIIAESLIETFNQAATASIDAYEEGLKIEIKEDKSPVSNGDLLVNEILTKKIKSLTPDVPVISEEAVNLNKSNTHNTFWLIDPIDGTKDYISGKDEYTLNAALIVNKIPSIGLVHAPKKNRFFYSYGPGNSYLIENGERKKLNNKKKTPPNEIIAVTSSLNPSEKILNKLKENGMTSFKEMRSSYKFCVVATAEFDLYAAEERAYEWDYAAGHAIAAHAGAIISTLDGQEFNYGKSDYKNLSLLLKRSKNLND
jgi:3'(2'), 5'-bisphosphate nucleotidase